MLVYTEDWNSTAIRGDPNAAIRYNQSGCILDIQRYPINYIIHRLSDLYNPHNTMEEKANYKIHELETSGHDVCWMFISIPYSVPVWY